MRAVWSFWSTPYRAHYHRLWYGERHHLFAWVLSVMEARKHYPDTCLVTDSGGARLLVEGLGLPFSEVDLSLDRLNEPGIDNEWWVLGKLAAYAAQTRPFVHLDNDVFLWQPLPGRMTAAPVLAQNPEVFYFDDQSLYRLDAFLNGIRYFGGWLPEAWLWYAGRRGNEAVCCGLFGGHDLDFIRSYAERAMAVVGHPENQRVWPTLGVRDNILIEQYFLAACLHYRRSRAVSTPARPGIEYLFASSAEAFDAEAATRAGYTHLIGEAKNNPAIAARLEARVRRDYPASYERCLARLDWPDTLASTPPCM